MTPEAHITIAEEKDIVAARQKGRELAAISGFMQTEQTLIATAISEIARNIVVYAKCGEMFLKIVEAHGHRGVLVVAQDKGPGIADVGLAMRDGYSTGKRLGLGSPGAKRLGLGLPGAKRLMDEFEVVSSVGHGTTVTMTKWVR